MKKSGCELVGDGEIRPDPRWHMPPHHHANHHEIILIVGGSMLLRTPEQELLAVPGDVLFYKIGLIHEEISQPDDPVNTLFIAFRFDEILPDFPLRLRDSDGRIRQLLSWLIQDLRQGRPPRDCRPMLRTIIGELKWLCASPRNAWLEDILAYMNRNFARDISLGDVARQAGMSRFAFIRKFKCMAGRTPMEQLRLIRLNEARNRILSSGLPLKSIAPAVGLGDQYQLSKLFRRHFGHSPREMRAPSRPLNVAPSGL